MQRDWIQADFNGLFGDILCLSHSETARNQAGEEVRLYAGMQVTAFEPDLDENGNPDNLLAMGRVVASPEWLSCRGSRWCLQIDSNGWMHESDWAQRA